ncbi:hypothetical protein AWW66_02910 [Micromonospora rosaria]|uniref:Transmembrane protein n=1 Tax=Micromonospora rosaria TaxID=47874 RepID=A0A136PYI7_9ACTN|nr:hypothetical protein [Micromonospora rosaria]KXK63505.1 hypothetical protein AWW66_02910 [Micromonospora rosaria]
MTEPAISPTAAADALTEIRNRRDQAIDATLVPGWYWPAVGGLMVAFTAAVETARPWVVAVGSVGYALGLGALVTRVALRHRAQVRNDLLGVRGGLAIVGYVLTLVALGLGSGFAADAAGLSWPATIGAGATGLTMALSGHRLTGYLRSVMSARPIGGGR